MPYCAGRHRECERDGIIRDTFLCASRVRVPGRGNHVYLGIKDEWQLRPRFLLSRDQKENSRVALQRHPISMQAAKPISVPGPGLLRDRCLCRSGDRCHRTLPGAIPCLGPGLCADPGLYIQLRFVDRHSGRRRRSVPGTRLGVRRVPHPTSVGHRSRGHCPGHCPRTLTSCCHQAASLLRSNR